MLTTDPLVTVVVPVRNGADVIRDCVGSLLAMEYTVSQREIIVVDNGSTDETAEIVAQLPVRYLREARRRGAPAARNAGIQAGRGEIIAFTDADCIASSGWLRHLVRAFDDPNVGAVAGEIFPFPPKTPAERYAARVRHLAPERYLARPRLPFAVFANLAFRRPVFDRIGLLDEKLIQGDSTDFCTRFLRGTDLKLVYAPQASVFHRHRATTWEFMRQQWNYGRGHALLYIKYRREIPWGWRQSALAYRELVRSAAALMASGLRARRRGQSDDLSVHYFDFLKAVAERLGFIRQSLAEGHLYL